MLALAERYTPNRRCIHTVSWMEAQARGRALEQFVKRQIESGGRVSSLLELSRATGIRPNTMYDWFTGRRSPRTDSLARVALALGISTSNLLDAYEGRAGVEINAQAIEVIEAAVARQVEAAVARGVEAAIRRLQDEGRIAAG